jgi:nitrite reductase (cytochrome c-552)
MTRSATALTEKLDAIVAARQAGATPAELAPALELQRAAQWCLDFVAAENSMGFHPPRPRASWPSRSTTRARGSSRRTA